MRVRGVLGIFVLFCCSVTPAFAQDATLAPADEYFGRFSLSVLGVANSIRDSGARIDAGDDPQELVRGPLAFVTDAIHAWEARYPDDPWIARDLLALENVYLKMQSDDGFRLASSTEAWLLADYPNAPELAQAEHLLDQAAAAPRANPAPAQPASLGAWERFAALRVPLPPEPPR